MVMVVDGSEEATKKKTKKGKKVKIAGVAGKSGMTNGNGGVDETAMGAVQDGAVIDDPDTLGRFEVGLLAVEGVLSRDMFTKFLLQSLDPSEMANGVTAASADDIQDHLAQGRKHPKTLRNHP